MLSRRFLSIKLTSILILVILLFRVFYFRFFEYEEIINVVPDDAFYYLKLAENFKGIQNWTFDGSTSASGFHLLYGYFLVVILVVLEDVSLANLFLLIGVLSSISISTSHYLLTKACISLFGKRSVLATSFPFLTFSMTSQSTSMMESWLVVLVSSLSIYFVFVSHRFGKRLFLFLITLGVVGSLSRTDFGLLPAAMMAGSLVINRFKSSEVFQRFFMVLLGATIGVIFTFAHNFIFSGHFFQSSAEIKFYWSSVAGHNVGTPLTLLFKSASPTLENFEWQNKVLIASCLAALLLLTILTLRKLLQSHNLIGAQAFMGAGLVLLGYVLFYSFNSDALQPWYAANLAVPLSILFSGFVLNVKEKITVPVMFFIYSLFLLGGLKSIVTVQWPHQIQMQQAGIFLKNFKTNSNIGSWNAGIISFYSERPIINIDGLTNDEVLPFIKDDALFDYIKLKNIEYIADLTTMITNVNLQNRGGYTDRRMSECLVDTGMLSYPGKEFSNFLYNKVVVYKVLPECS